MKFLGQCLYHLRLLIHTAFLSIFPNALQSIDYDIANDHNDSS